LFFLFKGLIMVKISITSKLDGIRSWSLQALDTCPGSWAEPGVLVAACQGCYATTGNYRYPNVKAPREYNRDDWQRLEWVADMVAELENDRYFRWFDSGDVYTLALAEKILAVMVATPWCKHWLPTRMHKFPKFAHVFAQMQALPNVSVRFSSDSVLGEYIPGLHGSVIGPDASTYEARPGASLCQAYEHGGRCNGCRACWDKSVDLICYPAHGKKMARVINIVKG
jgi:Gene product 88